MNENLAGQAFCRSPGRGNMPNTRITKEREDGNTIQERQRKGTECLWFGQRIVLNRSHQNWAPRGGRGPLKLGVGGTLSTKQTTGGEGLRGKPRGKKLAVKKEGAKKGEKRYKTTRVFNSRGPSGRPR